jgi:hypothetical protein
MFALAHLSDPHLAGWSPGGLRALLNKRATGLLSWLINRRKIHLARVLDLLIADLKAQRPDHVALTGDIVNISADDEFVKAASWLHSWARPASVSVIPGNHDAYIPVPWEKGVGLWAPFMTSWRSIDEAPGTASAEVEFPYVRVLGDIAIVGMSSALPMPFRRRGRISAHAAPADDADLTEAPRTVPGRTGAPPAVRDAAATAQGPARRRRPERHAANAMNWCCTAYSRAAWGASAMCR